MDIIIRPFITTFFAITQDTAQRDAHVGWTLHRCQAIRYLDGIARTLGIEYMYVE